MTHKGDIRKPACSMPRAGCWLNPPPPLELLACSSAMAPPVPPCRPLTCVLLCWTCSRSTPWLVSFHPCPGLRLSLTGFWDVDSRSTLAAATLLEATLFWIYTDELLLLCSVPWGVVFCGVSAPPRLLPALWFATCHSFCKMALSVGLLCSVAR
jgi:hypothetical protein